MQSAQRETPAAGEEEGGDHHGGGGGSNSSTAATTTFRFPREYWFPPFFTRQHNALTFHAQCHKWASLILGYCRARRLWRLAVADAVETELFWNQRIRKRLSLADARDVLDWMRADGRADWVDAARSAAWIWWRTPDEWAAAIADWVEDTGQKNTVLTLYELTEGEATASQEFHGMDPELLQKALSVLVKKGKAQVFGQEDQQGVKFY